MTSKLNKSFRIAFFVIAAAIILFGEFLAPYSYEKQVRGEPNAPATSIHFRDADGSFHFRPFVYSRKLVDPLSFGYEENAAQKFPISLFIKGDPYQLLGTFNSDVHLFGVTATDGSSARLNVLGTDALGRDRFSRLIIAIRFSLLVCLIGTVLASLLGVTIGMISGYIGRVVDSVLMAITDTVLALPSLILILAARAAFPLELPPYRAATLLIAIFALTGWAEMARLARGQVRATREQDFVLAAKASGCSEFVILFRHILPNIASVLITQATIMLPYFLLSEVALSYLGVGLQEPAASLGNMLANAGDLGQLRRHPILLLSPAFVIFVFVLVVRLSVSNLRSKERRGALA